MPLHGTRSTVDIWQILDLPKTFSAIQSTAQEGSSIRALQLTHRQALQPIFKHLHREQQVLSHTVSPDAVRTYSFFCDLFEPEAKVQSPDAPKVPRVLSFCSGGPLYAIQDKFFCLLMNFRFS